MIAAMPPAVPRSSFLVLCGLACAVGLASFACAELDEVELGVCGNRIHEPEFGEDCDGSALAFGPDAKCGAPSGSAPCRLTCSPQAEISECPPGWGCGSDGVCRRPSAELELGSLPGEARAVGDLDGDGRDDVVLRGATGEASVAFFTEGRNLAELFVDPARREISDKPAVQPIVARMSSDGVDDLALPVIGDDISIRVFLGNADRSLENPFVELVTVPFGATGEVWMKTAFNPTGLPEAVCEIGGCTQSLLLGKTKADETRYAVLLDRELIELFRLPEGHRRQNAALARWDAGHACDLLAVSYRYVEGESPGNLVEFFPLCAGPGQLNRSSSTDPLGTVDALLSVSVSDAAAEDSLVISGVGDIDGDGQPDLLLNITDNDPETDDDPQTYALYGLGDGHFDSRADLNGLADLADRSAPLIFGHSWATSPDPSLHFDSPTWPRAMADLNADGRADFLLNAGVIALSTKDPEDRCILAGETVLAGPPIGGGDEPLWGYACLLVGPKGLIDAATAARSEVSRDWRSSGSHATDMDLQGQGRPGFAAIDKNKIEYTGQPTDHRPTDYLDLFWVDTVTSQLILQTITAEQIEQVAAGDLDGDFAVDLVIGDDESLHTIWGAPFDLARATDLSPSGFNVLEVFGEGLASASLGAERDGRLTIFRDGQWPALALIEPGECATPEDCHVRFAVGELGDDTWFAWALGVVRSSEGEGLRILRAVEGAADLGPAYDSASAPLVPLSKLELSVTADRVTVVPIELDGPSGDGATAQEAAVLGRSDDGLEIALLRVHLEPEPTSELCSPSFATEDEAGGLSVCFEWLGTSFVPGTPRPHGLGADPFVEVADADGDGHLDLSWITVNNHVMVLRGEGEGTLSMDSLIELQIPEPDPDEDESDEDGPVRPTRIDWIRWTELDGTLGREIVSSDTLGSGLLWGINVDFDAGMLDPRGALELEPGEPRNLGYRGDFDGDGIDDIALGKVVLFGQPVND
jgi:hypothetical protein